jgi:hypothetical protein
LISPVSSGCRNAIHRLVYRLRAQAASILCAPLSRQPCVPAAAVTIALADHRAGFEVFLEVEASPEEVAAVEQALRAAGADAPVEAAYERIGIGNGGKGGIPSVTQSRASYVLIA